MLSYISRAYIRSRKIGVSPSLAQVLTFSRMPVENRMDHWDGRWEEGKTGWHKTDVNPVLATHHSKLLTQTGRRILVPLCGKTLDMKWMYDNGHTVVGIEGIVKPVLEFFSEQQLEFNIKELSWAKIYQTPDERLKIYVCDLFKIDVEHMGMFDAVWDRGSLVAIYEDDRQMYSTLMKSLLGQDFRYLLAVMHYIPHEGFSGPPRNVPNEVVEQLYGDVSKLEVLEIIDMSSDERVKNSWGLDTMNEVVLLLTPKS